MSCQADSVVSAIISMFAVGVVPKRGKNKTEIVFLKIGLAVDDGNVI